MAVNINSALKTIGNTIKSLKSKKMSKTQFNNLMNTSYTILSTSDMKKSGNWTVETGNAILLNNLLSVYVEAKTSSATGAGNISDQTICTFTISDERITYIPLRWGVLNYIDGPPSHGDFTASQTGDHTWSCSIAITYTHSAVSETRYKFQLPVKLDVTKY